MPRKQVLSEFEKRELIKIPETEEGLIIKYSLLENDLSIIKTHCRGNANKLGFAILLCYMRYPGIILAFGSDPDRNVLQFVSDQMRINVSEWENYGKREQTRREHINLLQFFMDIGYLITATIIFIKNHFNQ